MSDAIFGEILLAAIGLPFLVIGSFIGYVYEQHAFDGWPSLALSLLWWRFGWGVAKKLRPSTPAFPASRALWMPAIYLTVVPITGALAVAFSLCGLAGDILAMPIGMIAGRAIEGLREKYFRNGRPGNVVFHAALVASGLGVVLWYAFRRRGF